MKKLIYFILFLFLLSCTSHVGNKRHYVGHTYEAQTATGPMYIEFMNEQNCQIRLAQDFMGMFSYPCKYTSVDKLIEDGIIDGKSPDSKYLDGFDYIQLDSVWEKDKYVGFREFMKGDFLARIVLCSSVAFLYNQETDEIICLNIDDYETFNSEMEKRYAGEEITLKDNLVKYKGARAIRSK